MKGEITYELREIKPFRVNRLTEKEGNFKQFNEIYIKNGYQSNAPLAIYKFGGIEKVKNNKGELFFKINLGELQSVEHYHER